ncbi:MAG TPA: ABC transporter permease [Candidatus Krumholzibacteria bacterium]|nr:ABC transporter permease [Candidatus Krumholzibacteria bacterium]
MKVQHIIRREFLEYVRRRSFIVSTLLVPVLMLVFFVVPVLFAELEPDKTYRVAVVDQTGEIAPGVVAALTDTLSSGRRKYAAEAVPAPGGSYAAERTARVEQLRAGHLDIVIAIPDTVLVGGHAAYITREERNMNVLDRFETVITESVIQQRLAGEGLDYTRVKDLTAGVTLDMQQMTAQGGLEEKSFLSDYGIVFVFTMILYSALLSWGMTISKSIIEEKGSRVIEVLLSAVTPRDLMVGKLVGVGLAGLTQLSVWASMGAVVSLYASMGLVATLSSFHIAPAVFLYLILFFVLGFMLFSSLFMTIGSVCSTEQDAQQLQGLITLPMIVPILCLMLLLQNPNSTLAVVLSLIPMFAPMIMLARIILLQPPLWQILLSVALILGSIYLSITFAARVFRVGILMYGKRPSVREIVRWYRLAG